MAAVLRWSAGLVALLLALPAWSSTCVWFADGKSIHQVDAASSVILRSLPLAAPDRLLMNGRDCGAWALEDKHRLLRFGAAGALEREIETGALEPRLEVIEAIDLDPHGSSLWITNGRRVTRLSAEGSMLSSFDAPGDVLRIQVALDGTAWLLGRRELWRVDAAGVVVQRRAFDKHLENPRFAVVDGLRGVAWLADEEGVTRIDLRDDAPDALRTELRKRITGLALDPLGGRVWAAHKESLQQLSPAGTLVRTVELAPLQVEEAQILAFDAATDSLWIGSKGALVRFTDEGQLVARISSRNDDNALGVPPFVVDPTLALLHPTPGLRTNDARPQFRAAYGALCNGGPCGFGATQFGAYSILALLNGQAVGHLFAFDPATGEARFTPPAPLPEGRNEFSAQARDGFGHLSAGVAAAFTVDTIAPRFVNVQPADGTVVNTPAVTVSGSLDEAGTVLLENASGLGSSSPNPQGTPFAFAVTLRPGMNVITLVATDTAGNRSTAVLQLTLAPPLSIEIQSPTEGASVSGTTLAVRGTFQGPANTGIRVNGTTAAIVGGQFLAQVPVDPGLNAIEAVAATPDGMTAERRISVTSSGRRDIEVVADPPIGLSPHTVTFRVESTAQVSFVQADLDGNGSFDRSVSGAGPIVFSYAQAGIYTATFVIHTSQGVTLRTVQVAVEDAALLQERLLATWGEFTQALAAGNRDAALALLTPQARPRYARVFDALLARMPEVVAAWSAPRASTLHSSLAEFIVTRPRPDGTLQVFLVYFLRDAQGVWRIDAL